MKPILALRVQVALGLVLGIVIGYLFSGSAPEVAAVPNPPTATPSPQAFTTLTGVWMVSARFSPSAAPVVDEVTNLSEGRITVFAPGENVLRVLDAQGDTLYEQTFELRFLSGEPPHPVEELQQIFILPAIEGGRTLLILTPNGETRYEFPNP